MTVRRLLFVLINVFCLLSAIAGAWQLADSRAQVRAVEWIYHANRMTDVAQQASASLAMERGITATVLASPVDVTLGMLAEMERVRASNDVRHSQMREFLNSLTRLTPDHPLSVKRAQLDHSRLEVERYRHLVDEQVRGGSNELVPERWIELMTRHMESLHHLVSISAIPVRDNVYTHAAAPLIKDVLFTLSEYVGRERALLGVAIAQGRQLTPTELKLLEAYRSIALHARRRVESIVEHLTNDSEMILARDAFEGRFVKAYEALRAEVYASSAHGLPYPVSAEEWYHRATEGIDSILHLSAAVSAQFEGDLGRLRSHAVNTQGLLVTLLLAVLGLVSLSVLVIRKRVLRPLRILERAAVTISAGDLTKPLPALAEDEFGRLGRVFEEMRETVLNNMRQLEADADELRKLNALIEHSESAMIVTSTDGIIEYANPRFSKMTGYPLEETIGRKAGFWGSGLTPTTLYREMWNSASQGQVWEGEITNRRKSGELYRVSICVSPVRDEAGRIVQFIGILNDISEHRRIKERLEFLSSHDELTHLPNLAVLERRFLDERAEAKDEESMISLVSFGISRFKRINDSRGRDVGDQLLKGVARRLTRCVRSCDLASRHSGTEFVLMVVKLQRVEELLELLEPIMNALNSPFLIKGERLQLTVRAGISLMPRDGETIEGLLRKATIALHYAEQHGLSHCIHTDTLYREIQDRLSLENELRLALDRGELELHYQPKVDVLSGRVVGVEALSRWRQQQTGEYVSPQRFIPIAEECGLIERLGTWALRQACRQNRAWLDAGLPQVVVAVNLSALQLRQPDLVETVSGILDETGLAPALLELELTESALMEDPEQANLVLNRLKALGLRLAIDDFGTGYSSLAYLSQFPIDELKIDRSFVRDVASNARSEAISTSVIALAHQMGLRVIAEGVETEEQLSFLHRNGCDEIQGYYFSRPIPAAAFAILLAADKRLVMPDPYLAPRTLLVVDDEPAVLAMIALALEGEPYRVMTARNGREALEILASNEVQIVLTDERMPEMSGAELLERVKTLYPDTTRIVLSGYPDVASVMEAINSGAVYKFFTKPWDEKRLRTQIRDAFHHQETLREASSRSGVLVRPAPLQAGR